MLGWIFVSLGRIAPLKKALWRAWYEYLASAHRAPEWTFMNYGYCGSESTPLELAPSDESDRNCIQLYNQVGGAIDLHGLTVLEVGSGRGGGASFIKRYLKPAKMTGVDFSASAIDFSRAVHDVAGLEFRTGDAENLPFAPESFDAVVNVESSHCYPSFEAFVSEVKRVLRPGGHFLYADFRDRSGVEDWRKALQKSGLTITQETDITANVLAALETDDERKRRLINKLIPWLLRRSFRDFAGVGGSLIYQAFRNGKLMYKCFVLSNGQGTASPIPILGPVIGDEARSGNQAPRIGL